ICKVGVFVDTSAAEIAAIAEIAKLDVVQLYGGESPSGLRVWRAFRLDVPVRIASDEAEAVLLDGPSNGAKFDWSLARRAAPKVIVAGGLDASNVADAIRIARPWGVDASSRLETAPGLKDPEKVCQFIRAAKDAAAKQAA